MRLRASAGFAAADHAPPRPDVRGFRGTRRGRVCHDDSGSAARPGLLPFLAIQPRGPSPGDTISASPAHRAAGGDHQRPAWRVYGLFRSRQIHAALRYQWSRLGRRHGQHDHVERMDRCGSKHAVPSWIRQRPSTLDRAILLTVVPVTMMRPAARRVPARSCPASRHSACRTAHPALPACPCVHGAMTPASSHRAA